MASIVGEGASLDYTPGSAVASGDVVVLGSIGVGIADHDIPANTLGAVVVDGLVEFPKATGAITAYAKVYWDNTAKNVTTTATNNTLAGYAVAAAASGDATVRVKLMKA